MNPEQHDPITPDQLAYLADNELHKPGPLRHPARLLRLIPNEEPLEGLLRVCEKIRKARSGVSARCAEHARLTEQLRGRPGVLALATDDKKIRIDIVFL